MSLPREDAICPACPDPKTAFRIEDVGMKFSTEGDMRRDDSVQLKVTRPVWEPIMLAHLEAEDDEQHRRLYDECVAALDAAGMTVEETARRQVDLMTGSLRRMVDDALQPPKPEILDLRPQLFAGVPQRLAELTPWTDRIGAFNRRVLEENS